jgi:hypothetical protein
VSCSSDSRNSRVTLTAQVVRVSKALLHKVGARHTAAAAAATAPAAVAAAAAVVLERVALAATVGAAVLRRTEARGSGLLEDKETVCFGAGRCGWCVCVCVCGVVCVRVRVCECK